MNQINTYMILENFEQEDLVVTVFFVVKLQQMKQIKSKAIYNLLNFISNL